VFISDWRAYFGAHDSFVKIIYARRFDVAAVGQQQAARGK
jgi:hypothetical protein